MILRLVRAGHAPADRLEDLCLTQVRDQQTEHESARRHRSRPPDVGSRSGPALHQTAALKFANCMPNCNPRYAEAIDEGCFARELLSENILPGQNLALERIRQILVFRMFAG